MDARADAGEAIAAVVTVGAEGGSTVAKRRGLIAGWERAAVWTRNQLRNRPEARTKKIYGRLRSSGKDVRPWSKRG